MAELLLKLLAAMPMFMLRIFALFVANIALCFSGYGIAKISRINLHLAYPEFTPQQHNRYLRASVKSQCLTFVESLKCWKNDDAYSIAQLKQIHGSEVLQQALDAEQGLIIVVPHLGTWEMMNAWINQFCDPTIMYKPVKNKTLNEWIASSRKRQQTTLVPTDETGVRAILKALKKGGVTVILPDHVPAQSGGIYAPFYGYSVLTTTLVSRLAQRTQCAVVSLCCIRRDAQDGFDVYCGQVDSAIYDADLTVSVAALSNHVEQMIRQFPTHYIWSYRRFKAEQHLEHLYGLPIAEIDNIAKQKAIHATAAAVPAA